MQRLTPLLAASLLAACATTHPAPSAGSTKVSFGPPQPMSRAPLTVLFSKLSQGEDAYSLWSDPDFQRRLAEGLQSDTEVEPPVTATEFPDLDEAAELMANDEYDKAIKILERANGDEASAVFDFRLGAIYDRLEQPEQALAAFQNAVEKYPRFRRAWKRIGFLQLRDENFQEGIEALTRALQMGDHSVDIYISLGRANLLTENYIAAESAYRMAILLDPGKAQWAQELTQCFLRQQRYAETVSMCEYLIAQDPSNAKLWTLQGKAYMEMDRFLEAAENFEMVDQMGASTFETLVNLGNVYINEGLYEMGAQAHARSLQKSEKAKPAYAIRAAGNLAAFSAFDDTRLLLDAIRDSVGDQLELKDRKELLKLEVRLAASQNAGEQEAAALTKLIELAPDDGQALLMLGEFHENREEYEEAMVLFERTADLEGFEAQGLVAQAGVLVKQRRYSEAVPLLREAQNLRPKESVGRFLENVERAATVR